MNSLRSALTAVLVGLKIHRSGRRGTTKELLLEDNRSGFLNREIRHLVDGSGRLFMEAFEDMGHADTNWAVAIFPPVLASYGLCDGRTSKCIRYFVSRPAGYPNSIFCDASRREGPRQQMNDWSRLAR